MFRILRILKGEHLPCGCAVGVYERYDGTVVRLLDARAPGCPYPGHRPGAQITPALAPVPGGWDEGARPPGEASTPP